ncbi:hypothetical protein [Thiohalophilus thiocyanatoxydans]|uniref:Membrane protein YqjE n=1 Tax=Thiohalophilus thiocyanatoxydans TaxID=381308 RepID=A0A4R8INH8_9GAMM|nr:hypothetical protein [Thiohalophilus thiocyanatoxydans]TDY01754.1 hypothetical protein EDC23_1645 [Thiohalophilus thiocyanatoxydans]
MKETDPSRDEADEHDGIGDIIRLLKALSADMVRLVLVEARLFGHTALVMIGLTVLMALLLVTSWLLIGAALVMTLASLQAFSLTGALLTVALAHLVLVALLFWRLRYMTRDLTFRESRASVNNLFTHARSIVDPAGQRPEDE